MNKNPGKKHFAKQENKRKPIAKQKKTLQIKVRP